MPPTNMEMPKIPFESVMPKSALIWSTLMKKTIKTPQQMEKMTKSPLSDELSCKALKLER